MESVKCELTRCEFNEVALEDEFGYCLKAQINLIYDDVLSCEDYKYHEIKKEGK